MLKGSALAAAAAAVGKLVVAKIAERPAAPPAPAPPAPAPAEPDAADAAEPDAPAEEAVAPADADEGDAAADGAAPVPGMSPEAAARLAEAKLREELLGRVEGQYKLRGETCPLSVQKQTVAELEATLAELRGERAAGEDADHARVEPHRHAARVELPRGVAAAARVPLPLGRVAAVVGHRQGVAAADGGDAPAGGRLVQ